MKKLLFLLLLLCSCHSSVLDCDRGNIPSPPWGTPSDTTWYEDHEYMSITYWYFNPENNEMHYKRYVSEDECDEWHPDSEGWEK
uniref:Uncharacterized protein n=1 Tax=viral metagenome TaxID=1070528 RepID=A0A6M3J168_9ZZZZ